jgi:hypothetical protein
MASVTTVVSLADRNDRAAQSPTALKMICTTGNGKNFPRLLPDCRVVKSNIVTREAYNHSIIEIARSTSCHSSARMSVKFSLNLLPYDVQCNIHNNMTV